MSSLRSFSGGVKILKEAIDFFTKFVYEVSQHKCQKRDSGGDPPTLIGNLSSGRLRIAAEVSNVLLPLELESPD